MSWRGWSCAFPPGRHDLGRELGACGVGVCSDCSWPKSFSFCFKKGSYGRTKSNHFLSHLGAGDLKLVYKPWRGLDIGYGRMDLTFCFIDNSWHVQSWERFSCSAPAVLICHWDWKISACRLPLLVILIENLWKRRKNGKGRVGVRGLSIQAKRGALEAVSNVQEDAGEIHSWGRDVGMQRASSNNGSWSSAWISLQESEGSRSWLCWVIST